MSNKLIEVYDCAVDVMADFLMSEKEESMSFEDQLLEEAQSLSWLIYNNEIQAMTDALGLEGLTSLTLRFVEDVMEAIDEQGND